ncbi:MAG: hypothetical protein AAF513_10630 [Pseudomonadota bacterium]
MLLITIGLWIQANARGRVILAGKEVPAVSEAPGYISMALVGLIVLIPHPVLIGLGVVGWTVLILREFKQISSNDIPDLRRSYLFSYVFLSPAIGSFGVGLLHKSI